MPPPRGRAQSLCRCGWLVSNICTVRAASLPATGSTCRSLFFHPYNITLDFTGMNLYIARGQAT